MVIRPSIIEYLDNDWTNLKAMISLENSGFDTFGVEPSVPFRDRAISRMNIDPDRLKLGGVEDVDYEKKQL